MPYSCSAHPVTPYNPFLEKLQLDAENEYEYDAVLTNINGSAIKSWKDSRQKYLEILRKGAQHVPFI